MTRAALFAAFLLLAAACGSSVVLPATLDSAHEMCGSCRMIVSDPRMASQLVAPYEEPRFFDDLSCLEAFLKAAPALPKGAVIYVADHRTRAWVRWDLAVYTRVDALSGPMGSHVVAHASAALRDADGEAARGTPLNAHDVFPASVFPGGS